MGKSGKTAAGASGAEAAAEEASTSAPAAPERTKAADPARLKIEGHAVEGISVAGHETCVIFPSLGFAFDIGRCPRRAVWQRFLFVSHAHMDHIGGLPMYVWLRELHKEAPPTIFVPPCLVDRVAALFDAHRAMDGAELPHTLVPLGVGEEHDLGKGYKVKAFRTYHVVPSQGYLIYLEKKKLKDKYTGLPGSELKKLRQSGVEIMNTLATPEIAFTGDTMSDFILDPDNADVLKAKILILESTYLDNSKSIEDAREKGHTHLFEIANYSDKLENKAILLIHFSFRYKAEEIDAAINTLPPSFRSRVYALKEGF